MHINEHILCTHETNMSILNENRDIAHTVE